MLNLRSILRERRRQISSRCLLWFRFILLCLASLFKEVSGVEISQDSIKWAKINAESNGIENTKFLAGNAEDIFGTIDYPSEKTTVVIE